MINNKNLKPWFQFIILFCIITTGAVFYSKLTFANDIWQRPVIVPVPSATNGVPNPVMNLSGAWKFSMFPPAEFWLNSIDISSWQDIMVPGECLMQGFNIKKDVEYAYKKLVTIPSEYSGNKIILKFYGVYSYARVWANGKYIRDHHGGFTSWDCDITEAVTPGKAAQITVAVTDKSDDISWGSNYAKHNIGGILRAVKLIASPVNHIIRFHVETDLTNSYIDAIIKVTAAMAFTNNQNAIVKLKLLDPQNNEISLKPDKIELSTVSSEASVTILVSNPQKWDAEHPVLYTLNASTIINGSVVEAVTKKIGFREIEIKGNKVLVNGREVKLRGGCRHDVHPVRGRSTTDELDEKDAILFRDANINFIRTSHYPPSEKFLEMCDQYGLYVEEESAVCFVDQPFVYIRNATESDPEYTSRYMNQFSEMIERDRSHPCVILWSLGNESAWGANFQKECDYVRNEDPSRPVVFSYPEKAPQGIKAYDVYSVHYPTSDGYTNRFGVISKDFSNPICPELNDEYVHVCCYNRITLQRDPGVRDFWGESIKIFWNNMFQADGCLGGAIWGLIDEVFLLPDLQNEINDPKGIGTKLGYGEWGIIDGWRRTKPEYWHVKKAYSPIRIEDRPIAFPGRWAPLTIPVRNWFDHTNLNELVIQWSVGLDTWGIPQDSGTIANLNVPPHTPGTLVIPARRWRDTDIINLKFYKQEELLVDEFNFSFTSQGKKYSPDRGPAPRITEDSNHITVSGADFSLCFSKTEGLITEGIYRESSIINGGPYLNLGSAQLPKWVSSRLGVSSEANEVVINSSGTYDSVKVDFKIKIDCSGLITTAYTVFNPPANFNEIGAAYILSDQIDRFSWQRKGLWSVYPSDHIGRNSGIAYKTRNEGTETYGFKPSWSWSEDMKDFFLFGRDDSGRRGTNDFRSLKANIYYASCILSDSNKRVRAESDGNGAVRLEIQPDGKIRFNVINEWSYPDIGWGNYSKKIFLSSGYTNTIRIRLTHFDE